MIEDTPPKDEVILQLIDEAHGQIAPDALIQVLCVDHDLANVIEALQRAIERGKISLDSDGMIVATRELAHAA